MHGFAATSASLISLFSEVLMLLLPLRLKVLLLPQGVKLFLLLLRKLLMRRQEVLLLLRIDTI